MLISEHPVLRKPRAAEIRAWRVSKGDPWVRQLLLEREERIRLEKEDPYRHGFLCSLWGKVDEQWAAGFRDVLLLGGNRSSKSEYAVREVVRVLVEKPGARGWCFQSTAKNSREMQQPLIYKYLPREWRNLKKGVVENISYSQKGGFTEETFVLPNGSQCWFRNYEQDITTIEGGELDFIWADELVPASWLETLRFRLVTRDGRLLVTFTPIEGYNSTVKTYLQGAKTLETADAELLPLSEEETKRTGRVCERVPRVQECITHPARIVYFDSKDNPYGGYERLKKDVAGATRAAILCRVYGVPTRAMAQRFPRFNDWNVVQAATIPTEGTRFQVADPAGGRNYFMIWAIFDRAGTCWIYREWPGNYYVPGWGVPGMWAEPSEKADGNRGPAQSAQGWGLKRYKEEIERLEGRPIESLRSLAPMPGRTINERPGWRERRLARMTFEAAQKGAGGLGLVDGEWIRERFMDIRAGNTTTARQDRPVSLLEEWEEQGVFFTGVTGRASEGRDAIDAGVHLVNDWLDWNPEQKMGVGNRPRLFVSEECPNVIYALKEWTGLDGKDGACKDPVDVVRYLVESGACYMDEGSMVGTAGGHW